MKTKIARHPDANALWKDQHASVDTEYSEEEFNKAIKSAREKNDKIIIFVDDVTVQQARISCIKKPYHLIWLMTYFEKHTGF